MDTPETIAAAPTAEADTTDPTTLDAAPSAPSDDAATPSLEDAEAERRRLREQLEALELKQAELRRALAMAEHPALADAMRAIEGRVYAVARADARSTAGLSKAEEKRKDALEKKLAAARGKRDEIDAQIAGLEAELEPLGEARRRLAEAERQQALDALVHALGAHDAAFRAAGLDVAALVPGLGRWMPEVRASAEAIVARGRA